jgi:hypothetical protein
MNVRISVFDPIIFNKNKYASWTARLQNKHKYVLTKNKVLLSISFNLGASLTAVLHAKYNKKNKVFFNLALKLAPNSNVIECAGNSENSQSCHYKCIRRK